MTFSAIANNLVCIRSYLSLSCQMFLRKTLYQFVKCSFVAQSISVIKISNKRTQSIQKLFIYTDFYYWLRYRITKNRRRNRYTLNKKSYLHWPRIATYLYLQLTKLLLISHDMNYPRKKLIYLKQLYTFRSNQIKFRKPKSSLPLKRFIVRFITTLNLSKPKVR